MVEGRAAWGDVGGDPIVKNLSVSDADIVEAYKTKAIKQICREMKVGINRVRAVLDKAGLRGGLPA